MQLSAVAARRLAAAPLQNTATDKGTVVTDDITQTVPSSVDTVADDDDHDDDGSVIDDNDVLSVGRSSSSPHNSVDLSLASLPLSPQIDRGTKRKRTHDENIASATPSGVTFPLPRRRVHDDR